MSRIALIHNGSGYIDELLDLLKSVLDGSELFILRPEENLEGFDAYVFSGRSSRSQVSLKDAIRSIKSVLESPTLYICFGAEALNLYLGGTLRANKSLLKGEIKVEFRGSSYIQDGDYYLYASRHLNIGRLNRFSRAVGFSSYGIEAFEFKRSLAVMFHPERSEEQGGKLVRSFFEKI